MKHPAKIILYLIHSLSIHPTQISIFREKSHSLRCVCVKKVRYEVHGT